ncbi:CrcB family protein [Fructilactobacillus vespulae]|uniref:fluoride efflux transporter FluC n=1 Tax=Fructilactobacillus vespulae TaxID=1249630 RepID=UPI0039B3B75E
MNIFLIFISGMFGGLLRYSISDYIIFSSFPLITLLINLSGAFFLPFWTDYLGAKIGFSEKYTKILGTGFIGSFTTFSGMILDSYKLLQVHQTNLFFIYLFLNVVCGLVLAILGDNLANHLNERKQL